jgi:hypothetical protein
MTARQVLEQFPRTDPRDVGCDRAIHVLDVYVELLLEGNRPAAIRARCSGSFPE